MRSNQYIVFLLVAVLWIGCRPDGVLRSRQMREVLVDLHKADAIMQVSGMQHGYDEDKNIYYAAILDKHGITQAQFDSSLVWYTANPHLFDKIYPKVLSQLESERDAYIELDIAEMNASLQVEECTIDSVECTIHSVQYVDSILWVSLHGYPSAWNPYTPSTVHNPPFAPITNH